MNQKINTELRHSILGLLSISPLSGYDISKAFGNTIVNFWYADKSQIYRTLDRLSMDGLIKTTTIRQPNRPDRNIHELTSQGQAELLTWIKSPHEEEQTKDPFLARLFFGAAFGESELHRLLDAREDQVTSDLQKLQSIPVSVDNEVARLRSITRDAGIARAQAELSWIKNARQSLNIRREK